MSDHQSYLIATAATLTNSAKIIFANKIVFLSIFVLLALPLSSLHFSLSISSLPLKAHIRHLESIAALSSTRSEARHVLKESRESAISLLYFKLLYFVPSYLLSLLASISAVSAAHSVSSGLSTTFRLSFSSVKSNWSRPLVTSICIHVILFLYSCLLHTLGATAGSSWPSGSGMRLTIWILGWGVEVYLMAVMGIALVVSILDKRSGFDAIRVGSDLMEGQRVYGWILSGLLAMLAGLVGWKMEVLMMGMDDGDDSETVAKSTAVMGLGSWEWVGLASLYGLVLVWGYVVITAFYCECRRRHAVREEDGELGSC